MGIILYYRSTSEKKSKRLRQKKVKGYGEKSKMLRQKKVKGCILWKKAQGFILWKKVQGCICDTIKYNRHIKTINYLNT